MLNEKDKLSVQKYSHLCLDGTNKNIVILDIHRVYRGDPQRTRGSLDPFESGLGLRRQGTLFKVPKTIKDRT